MEQDKKQKPELAEEQLKEVGGHFRNTDEFHEDSNPIEADGKLQIGDEKLTEVAGGWGGLIPVIPIDNTDPHPM